jgi:hypothetical protein
VTFHLKKKGLFLFILIVILFLINLWLGQEFNPHYPLQYNEVFHPRVRANVVIMGASHSAHGIHPKYLETDQIKVFNFSMDGAPPSFNVDWYRKIFRPHYPRPICVIYGVHWVMFDNHILQRRLEQDSHYFTRAFLFGELLSFNDFHDLGVPKTLLLNQIPLLRGRKTLAEWILRGRGDHFVLSRYYHGFVPYERRGRVEKNRNISPQDNQTEIQAFESLLDEFEKDKIRVVFVQVPGYLPARNACNIEESMQLLNKIAEERKIPFLDYDTKRITNINTDPSMFSDWVHLNEKGSDAFSMRLQSDLVPLLTRLVAEKMVSM